MSYIIIDLEIELKQNLKNLIEEFLSSIDYDTKGLSRKTIEIIKIIEDLKGGEEN